MNVFIDTEIWSFSLKKPSIENFSSKKEFADALKFHTESDNFLKEQIQKSQIYMTFHQLSEIFHVLGFRGKKMSIHQVDTFCSKLLTSKFITWFIIERNHIIKAMNLSAQSSIHIWDFLCVLPFVENVDILYTCDKHFLNASFQSLNTKIVNPLHDWIVL